MFEILSEIVVTAFENLAKAFSKFLEDLATAFVRTIITFPPQPLRFLAYLIDSIQPFYSSLGNAVNLAVVTVLATRIRAPSGISHRVMKCDDVFKMVVQVLTTDAYAVVSVQTPWSARLVALIKSRTGTIGAIASRSIDRILKTTIAQVFRISVLKIVIAVFTFLTDIFRFVGMLICLMVLADFVGRCYDNPDLVFKRALGQATARKKVHPVEGGVIRRRATGGSPP